MQGQTRAQRRLFAAGQQNAVVPKVMKPAALLADRGEHSPEARFSQQPSRQQVMAMQIGLVIGLRAIIDRPKR